MYHAAATLTPDEVYDLARMTFPEMVKAGTTTVGEFHYLHTAPDGTPYDDPNLLSRKVIEAALSVGIRIVLLRSAYLRSGYEVPIDLGQIRFFETAHDFCKNMGALVDSFPGANEVRFGVAPHSIRTIPLDAIHMVAEWARVRELPIHMHISEQIAENAACLKGYGRSPIALLQQEGLLRADFTAVHAIHITEDEIGMFAEAQATICSCPTTERNLGDGIVPVDKAMRSAIRFALGSDSQAQIDPLEDARQLDYHLRLSHQERAILDQIREVPLSERLFDCDCQRREITRSQCWNLGAGVVGGLCFGRLNEYLDCRSLRIRSSAYLDIRHESLCGERCMGQWPADSHRWKASP